MCSAIASCPCHRRLAERSHGLIMSKDLVDSGYLAQAVRRLVGIPPLCHPHACPRLGPRSCAASAFAQRTVQGSSFGPGVWAQISATTTAHNNSPREAQEPVVAERNGDRYLNYPDDLASRAIKGPNPEPFLNSFATGAACGSRAVMRIGRELAFPGRFLAAPEVMIRKQRTLKRLFSLSPSQEQ